MITSFIEDLILSIIFDRVILFCILFIFMNNVGYWSFLIMTDKLKIRNKFNIKDYDDEHKEYPCISFIIPAYNEEMNIKRKIQSMVDLNYPISKMEIIVTDDGSTDNTVGILKKLQTDVQCPLRLIRLQHRGPANALKVGSHSANGDIIVWTDADAFLQNKDAIHVMLHQLYNTSVGAVFGIALEKDVQLYDKHERHLFRNIQNLEGNLDSVIDTNGTFFAFRKEFVKLIRTDCINYDANLALEIRKEGYRVIAEQNIRLTHPFPKNIRSYLYRRMRMFVGCIEMLYLHYPILFNNKYGYYGIFIAPRNLLLRSVEPAVFIILCLKVFFILLIGDLTSLFELSLILLSTVSILMVVLKKQVLAKEIINQIFAYFAKFVGYFMFVHYMYHKNINGIWKKA